MRKRWSGLFSIKEGSTISFVIDVVYTFLTTTLSEQIPYCIVVYTLKDFLVVVIGIGGCQCHAVEILSG